MRVFLVVSILKLPQERFNMKIFTHNRVAEGQIIKFGVDRGKPLGLHTVVELWYERERNGLGDEIIYAHARITDVPSTEDGLYTARVLFKGS